MIKKALIALVACSSFAQGYESLIKIKAPHGKETSEHASLIAPRFIFTRWHDQTEQCRQQVGSCTFQGIPIVHIETFNDYAVMELEQEFENYLTPVDELYDLRLPEQHTVCHILEKNNSAHVQEDSCLKIRQQLQR